MSLVNTRSAPNVRTDIYVIKIPVIVEGFKTLRKGLAYCWSVALAAYPEDGRKRFEAWCRRADDRDIRWIVRQNLTKKRMMVPGGDWLDRIRTSIG